MERLIFEAEHEIFRESARRFFQREVSPHGERWREQGCVDREAFLKAGAQGYLLMWADPAHGGAGVEDFRYEQILIEENARFGDSGFFHTLHSRLVGPYIGKLGNDEQRARILPKAARGEAILAIAMTEPQTGSDLAGIRARAEEKERLLVAQRREDLHFERHSGRLRSGRRSNLARQPACHRLVHR